MQNNKQHTIIGVLGFLTVALGAFGAHKLRDKLDPITMHAYETGVLYNFIHLLAMAYSIYLYDKYGLNNLNLAFYFFLLGIILFSGSLYGISFLKLIGMKLWILGPITPVGGVCFMIGWALIVLSFTRK